MPSLPTSLTETFILLSLAQRARRDACSDDLYDGTRRISESVVKNFKVNYIMQDLSKNGVWESVGKKTKIVWIETPSNPLMKIIDIRGMAKEFKD